MGVVDSMILLMLRGPKLVLWALGDALQCWTFPAVFLTSYCKGVDSAPPLPWLLQLDSWVQYRKSLLSKSNLSIISFSFTDDDILDISVLFTLHFISSSHSSWFVCLSIRSCVMILIYSWMGLALMTCTRGSWETAGLWRHAPAWHLASLSGRK